MLGDTSQSQAALSACRTNLKSAGIGPDGVLVALRTSCDSVAVAEPTGASGIAKKCETVCLSNEQLRSRYPLIADVFQISRELNAIIFAKPHFSCLAAQNGEDIPPVLDDMAQIVGRRIRVLPGETRALVLKVLKKHSACILSSRASDSYGTVAVGRNLNHALAATLVLEKSAQVFLQARDLGGAKTLGALDAWLMHFIYRTQYSRKDSVIRHRSASDFERVIPADEMALREEISVLGRKLSKENLLQGTWGNISARLDRNHMLCTPSGVDYFSISPYDIVRVALDTLKYEGDIKPTGEKLVHAALLQTHPEIHCVIHTHPVHGSVFAAAHKKISPADDKLRALLNGDIEVAKYALPSTKALARNVSAAIKENRACFMENHGMVVCGNSVEDAYFVCRTAEACAREGLELLSACH